MLKIRSYRSIIRTNIRINFDFSQFLSDFTTIDRGFSTDLCIAMRVPFTTKLIIKHVFVNILIFISPPEHEHIMKKNKE